MTIHKPDIPMILALDPGGTSGVCLCTGSGTRVETAELGPHEHHQELWDMLNTTLAEALAAKSELHIVCESFEFRQTERHRDFINYIPREYIGVVKLFCKQQRIRYFEQKAAQAKGFWSDDKIQKLGLWVPGRKHAMDATRHYLYHRAFTLADQSLLYKLR